MEKPPPGLEACIDQRARKVSGKASFPRKRVRQCEGSWEPGPKRRVQGHKEAHAESRAKFF